MKIYKKIMSIVMLIILLLTSNVLGASTYVLDVVSEGEKKELENEGGYISKTITGIDEENGEVTVTIDVSNTSAPNTGSGTYSSDDLCEIMLVIDDSGTMSELISTGETRREVVNNAALLMIENILTNYQNVKIGIVTFSTRAILECDLTSDYATLESAINSKRAANGMTNLEAGLTLANNTYSGDTEHKIMIILTDGVPTEADTSSYDDEGNFVSTVGEITKNKLLELANNGVYMITMLAETSNNQSSYVESVFGTEDNPTVGKFYYIEDANINEVVTNFIYTDVSGVLDAMKTSFYNVTVTDYFPDEVLEYFDFEYVDEPNTGTVSESIDEETNTIEWDIGTLANNKVATLSYKLTLKDMENEELLDVVISTNDEVVLTYDDSNSVTYTVTLTNSPKVKLSENSTSDEGNTTPDASENEEKADDTTTSPDTLPYTGISYIIGVTVIGLICVCIFMYKKMNLYK